MLLHHFSFPLNRSLVPDAPKTHKGSASWTADDITALLEFLIAHKSKGDSGGFKKPTWTAAAAHVNKVLTVVQRRQLKQTYEVVKAIRNNSGWSWDDNKGADITPEKKGTWDNYVAKYPLAQPFQNAGWAYLEAFDALGSSLAKGAHVFQALQGVSTAQVDSAHSDGLGEGGGQVDDAKVEGSQEWSTSPEVPGEPDEPSTPPQRSSPPAAKHAASPGPWTDNKHVHISHGNQIMNSLSKIMNHITDIMETAFCPSTLPATPVRLQEAMTCAQTLKKNWLTSIQLVMLIDIFECEPHAAIAYQSMKDNEDLRKSWICMKLRILVPVVDENKSL
ncbi:uncharacterized protein LACBIDRAFT_301662 [Laccaria bicolor S238N-H82]|uniref:Predicted protein n=1 Tax=Laccaria bicolor (strain S238N-H82 / ATCC MYA-4686) TaxID=486041 RepID=B0CP07_LACBS|nr:uncharacterized protein LACBIDRAFT_301662 [Laccaria bicolor S238N-H82]EDR15389.1 predicted protein [Laccaria bicolor S238N-H82]|eukprot:XP_001873597.1 predicted protein [Laccaria bicolor S238N-H82]